MLFECLYKCPLTWHRRAYELDNYENNVCINKQYIYIYR